jgi:hypothetical protein
MSTRLHKAGSDRNCWANSQNNFFNALNGDHEYFEIVTNGNNPPTVKANTRFMVYATDATYTISADYATGNNEYIAGNTPTTLLSEAIFEPSDRTFTYAGATDFPSISDGTWYLYCRGCLDTNATTIGKGEYYISKTVTPTASYLKGGMYYNADRCLCTWTVASSTVSALILYKAIMPYDAGTSGYMLQTLGNGKTQWAAPSALATYPLLVINGFAISHDTDTDHDILFGSGSCTDSTNAIILTGSALTKQIDASWAAGDDAGGLFSGSVAANTVYYMFVIREDSDGSIDYGFDTSIIAANRPAGWTYYRKIGVGRTNSSSNFILSQWIRGGNSLEVNYLTPIQDISDTADNSSAILRTLSVATGVKVKANIVVTILIGAGNVLCYVSDPDTTDLAPATATGIYQLSVANIGFGVGHAELYINTDTSGRVRTRAASTGTVKILTKGYTISL